MHLPSALDFLINGWFKVIDVFNPLRRQAIPCPGFGFNCGGRGVDYFKKGIKARRVFTAFPGSDVLPYGGNAEGFGKFVEGLAF